jgi:hypothetical protein
MSTLSKSILKIFSTVIAFAFLPAWSRAQPSEPNKPSNSNTQQSFEKNSSNLSTLDVMKAMGHVKEVEHSMRDGTQSEGGGITIGR